ncbi:MAG: hypothetical protein R3B70_01670 [Polyangiaceae bacterium]
MTCVKVVHALVLSAGAALSWVAFSGCSSPGDSFCHEACDCKGCSESELQAYNEDFAVAHRWAADHDCSAEYDVALACASDSMECVSGVLNLDRCELENKALAECSGGGTFAGTSCVTDAWRLGQCDSEGDTQGSILVCARAEAAATQAGCTSAFGALEACRANVPDRCELSELDCIAEADALAACVADYCAVNPASIACP